MDAGDGREEDRVVAADDEGDPARGRFVEHLRAGRGDGRHEVVGDDGGISRVVEGGGIERDHLVTVDPVDFTVLDPHLHPPEVGADLVGGIPRTGPAERRSPVERDADERELAHGQRLPI